MSRSIWKGPFTRIPSLLSRKTRIPKAGVSVSNKKSRVSENIQIWSRAFMITPRDLSNTYNVRNGKKWLEIKVTRQMLGHRLGEFFSTRQPTQHKVYKRKQTRSSPTHKKTSR